MNPQIIISHFGDLPWPKVLVYGAILAAVYYFLAFNSGEATQTKLESLAAEAASAKRNLEQTKKAIADADKFEKEVKTLAQQFQKIHEYMPDNLGPSMLTEITSHEATQAGAVVTKIEPASGEERTEFYDSSKVEFSIEGTYAQIETFLSNLSKVPKILTFEKVKINQIGGEMDRPRLAMSGVVIGYKYKFVSKTDSKADPKAAGAAAGAAAAPKTNTGAPNAAH